ncbi:MAG: ATP-binding cassette domain-containing protein, partial [Ruminococcaceae bacterium]|nr:ATP-binding cassette domain-containing protein [Oscillospiraceae bacterium]
MAHFKIENLSFSYPKREQKVLDDINLEIHKGEYIVLCGSNGSGKTTLLRHLKSVLAP